MTWDPTPWFVGGGAEHSPELVRTLPYAALGGKEGVVSPGDLKVTALAVPGSQVRVAPGVAAIISRASGGARQTYIARNPTDDTANISATGSSSRSDLIIARIEDPFMAGEPWPTPEDPTTAVYVRTRVIPNVPPGTTTVPAGTTGIPLARIDIPSSTATITDAMITDLRSLVAPRSAAYQDFVRVGAAQSDLNASALSEWPAGNTRVITTIPAWATHVTMTGTLTGIRCTGACGGYLNAAVNSKGFNAGFRYDESAASTSRSIYVVAGKARLSDLGVFAGTTATFNVLGYRTTGTGTLRADGNSTLLYDLTFTEEAV